MDKKMSGRLQVTPTFFSNQLAAVGVQLLVAPLLLPIFCKPAYIAKSLSLQKREIMATSKLFYSGDLRTEITHLGSGNLVITDAPLDNKGRGEAFSPTDLLATALASCMVTIMGILAREHGFNIDGTKAEITKIMAAEPRRISEVHVKVTFPPFEYTHEQRTMLRRAAKTCPVALSLHPDIKQVVEFEFSE